MATDTKDALLHPAHIAPEPHLLGLDPEGWVYVSLTIFILIAIFYAKAHRRLLAKLDDRIAEARRSLDEAAALRTEAEALLAEAKAQQVATHKDAEAILAHARIEADQLVAQAKSDAETLIARRGKMAEDRIAAAERTAIGEVRARAATAAATAAGRIIAERHDATSDKALIERTIASLN